LGKIKKILLERLRSRLIVKIKLFILDFDDLCQIIKITMRSLVGALHSRI